MASKPKVIIDARLATIGAGHIKGTVQELIALAGPSGAADVIAGQIKALAAAYAALRGVEATFNLLYQTADHEIGVPTIDPALVPKLGDGR